MSSPGSPCYPNSPVLAKQHPFNRNGKALRGSKKSVLLYTTDCGDEKEDFGLKLQQRSISLTALHIGTTSQQQQPLEPRMAQLETLEAKMASIEVSLSMTPRRKKGGSISGGVSSPAGHRAHDIGKELDTLRVALQDKENIIQNLKGQLSNTLSNRLSLRNGAPPLTEADRKAAEERLQRLRRDADNKRLAIKNLKLALERLDITDNIDVRIQQAELEYRLGREELELLTLREEIRALQAALELADNQEKQKNDTIFSCISGSTQVTIHALEISADPKSPRFGAGPREESPGLYVDWAVEDSGLCKGDSSQEPVYREVPPEVRHVPPLITLHLTSHDLVSSNMSSFVPLLIVIQDVYSSQDLKFPENSRILEVNGKLVVGAGRSDLARLLAVAPDAAQIVVLRKGESFAALRTLRSDNLRLTHRIGYLEEQVRDLLQPTQPQIPAEPTPARHKQVQVFQKGPQVTALVANLPGLNGKSPNHLRQSLTTVRTRHSDQVRRPSGPRSPKELDFSSDGVTNGHHRSRSKQKSQAFQLTRSTASLDCKQSQTASQPQRRPPRAESAMEQLQKNRRNAPSLQSLEFDSEPTYYRVQDSQSRVSEHSDASIAYSSQETKARPAPPKKPLRLSLHRATSLQSVESAPPSAQHTDLTRKPMKRNHHGDPSLEKIARAAMHQAERVMQAPQPPPRTPSRAESCQSALRWPSPKPRPHLASVPMEKWC